MTENRVGSFATSAQDAKKNYERKAALAESSEAMEEQRLMKLLQLVSSKISERFRNLREAFRYIDTDHS